jgi:hypothetical protein
MKYLLDNKELPFIYPNTVSSMKLLKKQVTLSELLIKYPQGFKNASIHPEVIFLQFHGLVAIDSGLDKNIDITNLELKGINNESLRYTLDSATVRDVDKKHFCALITINGNEKGFDGASFSRMNNFDWKRLVRNKKNWHTKWRFEGSVFSGFENLDGKQIEWNFYDSYMILKYYRI